MARSPSAPLRHPGRRLASRVLRLAIFDLQRHERNELGPSWPRREGRAPRGARRRPLSTAQGRHRAGRGRGRRESGRRPEPKAARSLRACRHATAREVTTGFAILELKSASAAIWKSSQKGTSDIVVQPGSTKSWNLSDSSERADFYSLKDHLYVEGVDAGSCDIEFRFKVNGKSISDVVRYTFISANCERQPTCTGTGLNNQKIKIEALCGKLIGCEWSITDQVNPLYNCIAFSVGDEHSWINPVGINSIDVLYGDGNGTLSQNEIIVFYEAYNYHVVDSFENADVIYYTKHHAAKRSDCSCGNEKWIMFESKLGHEERIEHQWNQINSILYGAPAIGFAKNGK